MKRSGGRNNQQLRPVRIIRRFTDNAPGSVLIQTGKTQVLCTACLENRVPEWRKGSGLGWVTAEYDMLPGSTATRRPRNRTKVDGRTQEIQRLIGRALRSVVDLSLLGENTILLDCDVIQADGGTRTASITGAFVAMWDAVQFGLEKKLIPHRCITDQVAGVSVGLINDKVLLDLDYAEDSQADVDLNLAMTGRGQLIEVQAGGEEATFSQRQLERMIQLGIRGIGQLITLQRKAMHRGARAKL